jgi:hypothetical protein
MASHGTSDIIAVLSVRYRALVLIIMSRFGRDVVDQNRLIRYVTAFGGTMYDP